MIYYRFDLQLFAGEKTEKATPKRREEARKKGQVFRSMDLSAAVILLSCFAVLYACMPYIMRVFSQFMVKYLSYQSTGDLNLVIINAIMLDVIIALLKMTAPIFATAVLASYIVSLAQVGFVFSGESLQFKLERIDPISGAKRVFSKRALVEMLKSLFKVTIVGYVLYTVIKKNFYLFPAMADMELATLLIVLGKLVFEMAIKVGACLFVLGIMDYLYQWWEYEQSLKMSKEEIKEEYKQLEGDPQVKAKQKQRQREAAMRRMMAEVPKADVVITNPTHFAVALRYEAKTMAAPVVIAKGQDYMAQRIKEVAREHKVEIVENPMLARTLFYSLNIGQSIPQELYNAVAEVLAMVYRHKHRAV
ncbi:MAG: flagellar biosynthesis protein FlhB [Methylocystaceae bacterium]